MKVIDCHTHCFPDEIAERAVTRLTRAYQCVPSFDGTIAGLIGQMDAASIDISVVVPVATKPSQVRSINDWAAAVEQERVIVFGAMHPQFEDIRGEMARMKDMGIRGIKLHPNWQDFRPEDPQVFPIYESATKHEIVVQFHAGDELEAWPVPIVATPKALRQVHDAFPGMMMITAHLGGYRMWDEVEKHLLGTDVIFDMSACFPEDLPDDRYIAMIIAHGSDKVLFGSDSPCGDPVSQLERLLSLPLTDEDKESICWRNAARLFGMGSE